MDWTNAKIVKFIQAVETRPVLWDTTNKDYKDKNKKHDATKELGENFSCDSTEVMRKWKIILAQWRRERKKIADSKASGSGVGDIYKPKWFAFEHLAFIHGRDCPNVTVNTEWETNEQVRQYSFIVYIFIIHQCQIIFNRYNKYIVTLCQILILIMSCLSAKMLNTDMCLT